MPSLDSFFTWCVGSLLGLSGLLFVAESLGWLPEWFTRWMNRNRLAQTLAILRAFGVDIDGVRRRNRAAKLDQTPGATVATRVTASLKRHTLTGPVGIGKTVHLSGPAFVDLMGASCNPAVAAAMARDLTAHWRALITGPAAAADDQFDFVVTPKSGSPLLGAAFAQLMDKPFMLHVDEPKFEGGDRFRALFDCDDQPLAEARALIVDDSSTGGGKAIRLIEDLRDCGYRVSDMLVVFEPQLKAAENANAAERLKPHDVRLHAIVQT